MNIECFPVEGRRSHLMILCDGDPWREIHIAIFGHTPDLPKVVSSLSDFIQYFDALEYRLAKHYAIKRLSVQSLPSSTLARSLRERLVSEEAICRIIDEFSQLGYLNDREWTASFVRCQARRKVGPRAIAQKLISKGLEKEYVEEALEACQGIDQQKQFISQLLATRYRQKDLSDFRQRQKVIASLIRRGFDLSVIFESINDIKADLELDLN